MNVDILTKNKIDVNHGLELLGDMDFYNETLSTFYDNIEKNLKDLEKFKESDDFENYGILSHSIKSDSKYLGFMDLAEIALSHEMAGKSSDKKFIGDMIYGLSASTSFVKFGRSSSSASISVDIATGTDQVKKYYDGSQLQIANHPFVSASYSNGDLKGKALGDNQTVAQAATKYGRVSLKASFKDFTPTLVLPKENLSDDFYEAQKLPFNDVDANVWSAPYIKYAFYNGLMTGKSDTKFDPTGDFTRAQAVVVLYAAAGKPDVEITSKFSDLSADWYKKAVSWAVENGITGGTGDGSTFSPDDKVTKEQLALFLMKYAEFCDKDTSERKDISGFADAGKVDGWAKDAVEWAAAAGVITGDGTNIQPQGFADRQTAATMFRTAMKNVLLA